MQLTTIETPHSFTVLHNQHGTFWFKSQTYLIYANSPGLFSPSLSGSLSKYYTDRKSPGLLYGSPNPLASHADVLSAKNVCVGGYISPGFEGRKVLDLHFWHLFGPILTFLWKHFEYSYMIHCCGLIGKALIFATFF